MDKKQFSIAALVLGILGIIGGFIPIVQYFTLVCSILGIVFGVKGRKDVDSKDRGLATAGLVLGIVGLSFSALGIVCIVCIGIAAFAVA